MILGAACELYLIAGIKKALYLNRALNGLCFVDLVK